MDSKNKNTFSLLSVTKPQFKEDKKCKDQDAGSCIRLAEHVEGYEDINLGFGITILVFCCLVIILGVLLIAKVLKTNSMMTIYQILAFILAFLVIAYMITIWAYSADYDISAHGNRFKNLTSNDCFPKAYKKPANDLQSLINLFWDSIYTIGVIAFILACIFIVVELIAIILRQPEWRCSPLGYFAEY